jgi:hypothetical protein
MYFVLKFGPFLDLCVSSLRRGHANLLCIIPILSHVLKMLVVDIGSGGVTLLIAKSNINIKC